MPQVKIIRLFLRGLNSMPTRWRHKWEKPLNCSILFKLLYYLLIKQQMQFAASLRLKHCTVIGNRWWWITYVVIYIYIQNEFIQNNSGKKIFIITCNFAWLVKRCTKPSVETSYWWSRCTYVAQTQKEWHWLQQRHTSLTILFYRR